ncbi:MAG TPA: hypothetical protein VK440_02895 [Burkholderiales bacterium]|nr:hypothetical protein [Burkholderiales bacterium]
MVKPIETIVAALMLVSLSVSYAKLPPPSEEAKAKAAEAKAKAEYGDKVGAYQLCLAQNKIAENYLKAKGQKAELPACQNPGPFGAAPAAAPAATPPQAAAEKKK